MCGIVGAVDSRGREATSLSRDVRRMTETMAHRGPDDWGIVTLRAGIAELQSMTAPEISAHRLASGGSGVPTAVLGHRRLAIIDLSPRGHQPMATPDGRWWLSFGGEIYNYRALRKTLEAHGVRFTSDSDTEVLLELLARDGISCLENLRGMFSFAAWDVERERLYLARDRFGIKPLYYAVDERGVFLFGSELRSVLASGRLSRAVDETASRLFLRTGSIAAPRTIYTSIRALPPGSWAVWDGNNVSITPYWSLDSLRSQAAPGDIRHIAEIVRQAITETVNAHMVSDVPVGLFLSGGLDSTAVLAAVRQSHTGPMKTFTIGFPGTQLDESDLARAAARHFATDHIEVEVTEANFYDALDDFFVAMDQPTVDGVNTFFVSKLARQGGATVALSGVGGDEILGGYPSFVDIPRLEAMLPLIRRNQWLGSGAKAIVRAVRPRWTAKVEEMVGRSGRVGRATMWRDYHALFTEQQLRAIGVTPSDPDHADAAVSGNGERSFWSIARLEMQGYLTPQLLRDSDVFSMCHGLEVRTPLVDHEFMQTVVSAGRWRKGGAPSHKIALFREMRGFLSDHHLRQPKRGFTFPVERWLRSALAAPASSRPSREFGWLRDAPDCRQVVRDFLGGRVHWSRIWALHVLHRFR